MTGYFRKFETNLTAAAILNRQTLQHLHGRDVPVNLRPT